MKLRLILATWRKTLWVAEMGMTYHNPVLLDEAISGLAIRRNGIYVDATFGGGGHALGVLKNLGAEGKLFGFDHDLDAMAANAFSDERFTFVAANFSRLKQYLKYYKVEQVDGVLADFGVSSFQFDSGRRGFSTRSDARLDMRMNQNQQLDAFHVINSYSERQLADVFSNYGELKNAKKIAMLIAAARSNRSIKTTFELKSIVQTAVPQRFENKIFAQLFQAIRIEVNQEIEAIQSLLVQSAELLVKGGRLVCIAYHSLEDRLVKRFVQSGKFSGEVDKDFYGNVQRPFKKVGKLIVPSKEEIMKNGRARSAKLRIAEKI